MASSRANFTTRREPGHGLLPATVVTVCECGWETTARDNTLYGPPNALRLALLAHRLDHLEGRIP